MTISSSSINAKIRKSKKALAQMKEKGASTSLIEKRLQAFDIGLTALETLWHEKPNFYSKEEMAEARDVLAGVLPSIKAYVQKLSHAVLSGHFWREGLPRWNWLLKR